ncbi:MAG: radical SAM protein, partial [Thermoplasmata archaeon]
MKILFIQPHVTSILQTRWGRISRKLFFFPNLQILQLAAVTPKEWKTKIIDERHEEIDFNETCDIVSIYFNTLDANRSYEIADEFHRHGKTVVLGGYHPTVLPEEAKQHADSVVIGEPELIWPQLLKDYENEGLKPFYKQETPIDPRLIPA